MEVLEIVRRGLGFSCLFIRHLFVMFWWGTIPAFLLSALLQSFFHRDRMRTQLKEADGSLRSILSALLLGATSPPARGKSIGTLRSLLEGGAHPAPAFAYLVASQSLLIYFLFLITLSNGPQITIGHFIGGLVVVCIMMISIKYVISEETWKEVRERVGIGGGGEVEGEVGSPWLKVIKNIGSDVRALLIPLVWSFFLSGLIAAWGVSDYFVSLSKVGGENAYTQVVNALLAPFISIITFLGPVGNILVGSWIWKTDFVTYAGLVSFYYAVLINPFNVRSYFEIFGFRLGFYVTLSLFISAALAGLAVLGFWHTVNGAAGLLGLRNTVEGFLGSSILPSDIPWFHKLFQP